MTDVVRYRLPFGMIGRAVHELQGRDVKQIFDYRFKRIGKMFAGAAVEEPT